MPSTRPLRSRRWRGLLAAALTLAVLEGAWIATTEWLVRSGRVQRWMTHRPQRFQAAFGSLASPLPGLLVATDLDLRGQTERVRWQITADRAWGVVDPIGLITHELRFITLHGRGVAVHGYRIARAADPAHGQAMPPIPAFPGPAGPPKPRRLPWSWEFPNLHLEEVREVWIEQARVTGRLAGRGGFALYRRQDAEIFTSRIDLDEARLRIAGAPAGELVGQLRFDVARYPYHAAGPALLVPRLDARLVAHGTFEAARVADHFLSGVPWVALAGPPAPFTADVRIEEGRLRPGTRASFTPPQQEVRLFDVGLFGTGDITLAVTRDDVGERCDVALRFTSFAALDGKQNVLMRGSGLHAELLTRDLTLAGRPQDLAVAFDLGTGVLPDLARLGALLPTGAKLRLTSGRGTVTGTGHASSAPHSASGHLDVRLDDVEITYADANLRGDVRASVALGDGDLTSRVFKLDGTEIVAENFRTRAATGDSQGWWARAALPTATLDLGDARRVRGTFTIALRDTRPLVAVFNERRDLPRWAERALSIDDAKAAGSFEWRARELLLPRFTSAHGDGTATGSLRLRHGRADGRLLLTWKRLVAAIEFAGGERTLHLRGAREWYEGSSIPAPATEGH